jgi:hypothetical protein
MLGALRDSSDARLKPLDASEDLVDAVDRPIATGSLALELRFESLDALLALDELVEELGSLGAQPLMFFEQKPDGTLQPIEIVSVRTVGLPTIETRIGHAGSLHDPVAISAWNPGQDLRPGRSAK